MMQLYSKKTSDLQMHPKHGTVQFLTYTSQNLLDSYRPEIENLLNGLAEID